MCIKLEVTLREALSLQTADRVVYTLYVIKSQRPTVID